MPTKDYTTILLDMEDVVLKNIEENAQEITIKIELAQKVQQCPACGAATNRIHDYHNRTIRDLDLRGKRTKLQYRCRRYICLECREKFVFINEWGKHIPINMLCMNFKRIVRKMDMPDVYFHDLFHTYIKLKTNIYYRTKPDIHYWNCLHLLAVSGQTYRTPIRNNIIL